jgi:hypothetical protein
MGVHILQFKKIALQHPVALRKSGFVVRFSVYVQLCLTFALLFVAIMHYMCRTRPRPYNVVLTRQLLLSQVLSRLSLRCSHARLHFYIFVGRLCFVLVCVVVFYVLICGNRCTLLGGHRLLLVDVEGKI